MVATATSEHAPEDDHAGDRNDLEHFVLWCKKKFAKIKAKCQWGPKPPEKTTEQKKLDEMANMILNAKDVDLEAVEQEDVFVIWVDRPMFDIVMSAIIVMNTITIGLELDDSHKTESRNVIWVLLEIFFCLSFTAEVVCKVKYHTYKWMYADGWNMFTTVIASMAVVDGAILTPAKVASGNLRMLSLVRVVGMLRLLRIIRMYKSLRELRLVMQGLMGSMGMLCWTVIILVVFLYVAAVFTTSSIGRNTAYDDMRLLTNGWDHDELFGSVGRSMFTLLQCMTRDGWASQVARFVIIKQWHLSFFFMFFMMISTYGLLNLVVSVIVEQTLTAARNNASRDKAKEERSQRAELEGLKEIFLMADEDGSGELDVKEFLAALEDDEILWKMRGLDLPIDDAARLFTVIDGEGTRALQMEEFIDGCTKLKGAARSRDLLAITAQADSLAQKMDSLGEELQDCEQMLAQLDEISDRITNRFHPAIKSSRKKIAKAVAGSAPSVPIHPDKLGSAIGVDLAVGNRPLLPKFPNLLN